MIHAIPPKRNESALDYLHGLVARVEAGEVCAVTVVEEYPGGTYAVRGGDTMSRLQTAGMLLDAAVTRLNAP